MGSWTPEEHQAFVDHKRARRMEAVDSLTPAQRALVHEYGYHVVNTFICMGVVKPSHIRHLVETVLDEFSPTRGSYSMQGLRSPLLDRSKNPANLPENPT